MTEKLQNNKFFRKEKDTLFLMASFTSSNDKNDKMLIASTQYRINVFPTNINWRKLIKIYEVFHHTKLHVYYICDDSEKKLDFSNVWTKTLSEDPLWEKFILQVFVDLIMFFELIKKYQQIYLKIKVKWLKTIYLFLKI